MAASRPADLTPLQLAGSPAGGVAIGFGEGDADSTAGAGGLLVTGRVRGRMGPVRAIPGSRMVLAAAYLRSRPVVLAGAAAPGSNCCETIVAASPGRGAVRPGRLVLAGLRGPVQAVLVPDGTRLLAVIASEDGVWAALSGPRGDGFGPARRLSARREFVQSVAAAPASGGGVMLVWSARRGSPTAAGPTALFSAGAARGRLPAQGRLLLRVPADRAIDELALVPAAEPLLAWVQSGFTRRGRFDSEVWLAPVAGRTRARRLSSAGILAAGLAVAGRSGARPLVSWRGCRGSGACFAQAEVIPLARRGPPVPGRARTLGPTLPEEQPAATLTGAGVPLVGWIDAGGVRGATAAGAGFSAPSTIARTPYATGVVLAAAGTSGAFAAWIEGTARERVRAASLR